MVQLLVWLSLTPLSVVNWTREGLERRLNRLSQDGVEEGVSKEVMDSYCESQRPVLQALHKTIKPDKPSVTGNP